jgi:hypothetical protein
MRLFIGSRGKLSRKVFPYRYFYQPAHGTSHPTSLAGSQGCHTRSDKVVNGLLMMVAEGAYQASSAEHKLSKV